MPELTRSSGEAADRATARGRAGTFVMGRAEADMDRRFLLLKPQRFHELLKAGALALRELGVALELDVPDQVFDRGDHAEDRVLRADELDEVGCDAQCFDL